MNLSAAALANLETRLPRPLNMPKQYTPPHPAPPQETAAFLNCVFTIPFFSFPNSFTIFVCISKQNILQCCWFLSLIQMVSCYMHFYGVCFFNSIRILRFVPSFLLLCNIPLQIYHNFSIYVPVKGHLYLFQVFVIIKTMEISRSWEGLGQQSGDSSLEGKWIDLQMKNKAKEKCSSYVPFLPLNCPGESHYLPHHCYRVEIWKNWPVAVRGPSWEAENDKYWLPAAFFSPPQLPPMTIMKTAQGRGKERIPYRWNYLVGEKYLSDGYAQDCNTSSIPPISTLQK